jgi:hypothetical protein
MVIVSAGDMCAEHFQAKWFHLAARKMRPKARAFSSQVVSLGGSENAIKGPSIFKPSDFTWRLGKCDQRPEHFQAKWFHLAARKMRSNKPAFSSPRAMAITRFGDSLRKGRHD